ncbi:ABC transporter ATP-binding protein [Kiloniella majae]|uniref:ABC transporter ATP-binding protein n=1 Tax=Kiloniella majae TaxID=1938558 RepID=UPI0015C502E6|nr:ABC transporter ATP-binding protein [Kiloniella majae]
MRISYELGLPKGLVFKVMVLATLSTLFESIGLVFFVPVYQYIEAKGDVAYLISENEQWQLIDRGFSWVDMEPSFSALAAVVFVFVLLRQIASYIRIISVANARETLNRRVRMKVFSLYVSATLSKQEATSNGEIVNDLTLELQRFGSSLLGAVSLVGIFSLALIYLIILLFVSWEMTLISFLVISMGLFPVRFLYRHMRMAGRASTLANSDTSRFLVEKLQTSRLIRLAGIEDAERESMNSFSRQQKLTMLSVERLMASISVAIEPVVLLLTLGLLVVSVDVLHLQFETLGLFLMIVLRLMPVVKDFMKSRQLLASCAGSAEALTSRIQDLYRDREDDNGGMRFEGLVDAINFNDVTFYYNSNNKIALRNISVSIPAKKITAIIGPSGSGKSTLIDLLPRLRLPSKGQIEFDGRDVLAFCLKSLRSGISFVPQFPQVFNVSIVEHIRLGKSNATMDEVLEAAELAGVSNFIDALEDGYETKLGESGSRLSGGQRQRVDLARAIVSNSPVLILDEPTSNLDPKSELAFVEAIKRINIKRNTTIIMVAHRLSTIENADQIIVLNRGKVEGRGSHEEVLNSSQWYTGLFSESKTETHDQAQGH